ncbi:MAG: hypothetical protein M1819_003523 [Sarea resinae]|nr:MAG: hypothetical protein M1819_003523 [Sarea resinae]
MLSNVPGSAHPSKLLNSVDADPTPLHSHLHTNKSPFAPRLIEPCSTASDHGFSFEDFLNETESSSPLAGLQSTSQSGQVELFAPSQLLEGNALAALAPSLPLTFGDLGFWNSHFETADGNAGNDFQEPLHPLFRPVTWLGDSDASDIVPETSPGDGSSHPVYPPGLSSDASFYTSPSSSAYESMTQDVTSQAASARGTVSIDGPPTGAKSQPRRKGAPKMDCVDKHEREKRAETPKLSRERQAPKRHENRRHRSRPRSRFFCPDPLCNFAKGEEPGGWNRKDNGMRHIRSAHKKLDPSSIIIG